MEIMVILLHFQFKDFYSNIRSPLALVDYLSLIKRNKFTFALYKLRNTAEANSYKQDSAKCKNFAAALIPVSKVIGTFPQA